MTGWHSERVRGLAWTTPHHSVSVTPSVLSSPEIGSVQGQSGQEEVIRVRPNSV